MTEYNNNHNNITLENSVDPVQLATPDPNKLSKIKQVNNLAKPLTKKQIAEQHEKGFHTHKPDYPPFIIGITQLIHRKKTGEVVTKIVRFKKELISKEEPFQRRFTLPVSDEWYRINIAWIERPHRILLRNEGGRALQVYPTKEQIQELLSKEVKVGCLVNGPNDTKFVHPFSLLRPYEDLSIAPIDGNLYLLNNVAEVDITILAIDS